MAKDWDDYVKLRELADRLVAAQAAAHAKADAAAPPRPATDDEKLAAFHAWLRREGYPLDTAPVQVTVGLAEGGGLVARQAIKARRARRTGAEALGGNANGGGFRALCSRCGCAGRPATSL